MSAVRFGRYVPTSLREWDRVFAPLNAVVTDTADGVTITVDGLPNFPTSKITSGTFANARISLSSVMQHQQSLEIEWPQLTGTPTTLSGYGITDALASSRVLSGAGSPEGVVTATPGTLYTNTSGGANTTLYVKESGSGSTGWIAK